MLSSIMKRLQFFTDKVQFHLLLVQAWAQMLVHNYDMI